MTGEHGNSIRNTLHNNLKKQNIKLFLKHHVIKTQLEVLGILVWMHNSSASRTEAAS